MPSVYLSPSTQEFNPYFGGGNEEYYMFRLATAMLPYMKASGILFSMNSEDRTAADAINDSNAGNFDFHLALHSNAAAAFENRRGIEIYYFPGSQSGRRFAEILAQNLKVIYPLPRKISLIATTELGEVQKTRAPAVLVEYGYHDDPADADWIRYHIDMIAKCTVLSLCEYFGIVFRIT